MKKPNVPETATLPQEVLEDVAAKDWTQEKAAFFLGRHDVLLASLLQDRAIIQEKTKFLLAIIGGGLSLCFAIIMNGEIQGPSGAFALVEIVALVLAASLLIHHCFLPTEFDAQGDEPKTTLMPDFTGRPMELIMLGTSARLQQRIADNRERNKRMSSWLRRVSYGVYGSPVVAGLVALIFGP
jgi:hypothetical protein